MATEKKKTVSKKAPVKKTEPAKETEQVKVDTEVAKTEEVVEEKAAPKKAPARKTTTRKTATKTTTRQSTAKKTTTKKVPKNVVLECYGRQIKIDTEKYEEEVKNIWLNDWKRPAKDLKEIDMYIKPEDGKVYFVVNGTDHGALAI